MKKNTKGAVANNKNTALSGVLIALALVLSYLESLIPIWWAVPGIKLGLANIVTIIALGKLGLKQTIIISVGRILLSGILFGNITVIVYSMSGALLSIFVMYMVKKVQIFTNTGVSVCGAIAHNMGQIIVAAIVMENIRIMYYMAVLLISGTVTGTIIGVIAGIIAKNIRF